MASLALKELDGREARHRVPVLVLVVSAGVRVGVDVEVDRADERRRLIAAEEAAEYWGPGVRLRRLLKGGRLPIGFSVFRVGLHR